MTPNLQWDNWWILIFLIEKEKIGLQKHGLQILGGGVWLMDQMI